MPTVCARKEQILFCKKKNTLIQPQNSLKLISSTCSNFLLTPYLLSLVDVFFQQTVGIPMGTSCALLLTDLFLYSYEADFMQGVLKKRERKEDSLIF